jgi:hypothetical protein
VAAIEILLEFLLLLFELDKVKKACCIEIERPLIEFLILN